MIIGVSAIGWDYKNNNEVIDVLTKRNFDYVEATPSNIPKGIKSYSIQGIFYNSGISNFSQTKEILNKFEQIIQTCVNNNISIITLGSPKMRTGSKSGIKKVFDNLDDFLQDMGITVCVEPNAREYGAEYYWSLEEIVEDIHSYKSVKTMIDTGSLIMEGLDVEEQYLKYFDEIKHFHFSAPNLDPISDWTRYREYLKTLKQMQYNYGVTYEVRKTTSPISNIEKFFREMEM